ncbi:GNAT family N-acetyltransferase [Magnetospirillum molischianum]|uniref:Putative Histone acetyltransferase HPA2 and related acetyltransferase n=1 Tax=Magnetospirillum molischianum DSM 120 TaxID=1150626 RepID=H8FP38_MAGML|nr:GNAT family N-acetyltransferase [Magnetospirillum molischianum]CCG40126.1 putative Histone acetyltransferase HPA2 and related acetyltransferase [Magnetospirillum molischianum DSM 120]
MTEVIEKLKGKPSPEDISVEIATSHDQMQMIVAVRALVFLGQPGWTYEHTFDENDHCATHILAKVGGEPAGTVRIRWFCEFARIERIAIRDEFRSLALLNKIATTALRLCRRKGYDKVGGLAYPGLIRFWSRHGAEPVGEQVDSIYGPVIPILGEPRHWDDIVPMTLSEAGDPNFERTALAWEGAGV